MSRWLDLAPIGLLAAVLLILLGPALVGGRVLLPADIPYAADPLWQSFTPQGFAVPANPILADQINQFYPWHLYTRQLLQAGSVPLWNPYAGGGRPHLGNGQAGIFSPFEVLRLLLPVTASYGWTAFARLMVAGVSMLLYARTVGLQRAGAAMSMLVFTLSGPLIVWLGHPHSNVMVWLPAMLYTGERLLATGSRGWLVACAVVMGFQLLGGHPETSFQVTAAWLLYLLLRAALPPSERRDLRRFAPVVPAALLGVLLAGVHLLPFVETLPHSMALAGRTQAAQVAGTDWLRRLFMETREWPAALAVLLPRFFGSETDNSYWYPNLNSVEQSAYAGVLPLALALVAAAQALRVRTTPQRSLLQIWTLLGVGSLAVALRLPIANGLNFLPIFNVAAPGRLRVVFVLAVAVLAGAGLDHWLAGDGRFRQWVARLLLLFAVATVGLAVAAYLGFTLFEEQMIQSGRAYMEANWGTPYFTQPLASYYDLVVQRQAAKLALYNPLRTPLMFLPVWVAGVWWIVQRQPARWVAPAALLVAAADLVWAGYGFNPAVDPALLAQKPALIEHLEADPEPFRILATGTILNPESSMRYGIEDVRGYDPMAANRYVELLAGLPGYYPVHYHLYFMEAASPLFDLLNVKYLLTEQPQDAPRWEAVAQDGSVRLYRNRDVWPRAYVVYETIIANSAEESLARLHDPAFDFRRQVILEGAPPGWVAPAQAPVSSPPVQIAAYTPHEVTLQVDTPVPGVLVLADSYMPGWQARVDDWPVPILVANHALRAIVVPGGAHTVTFAYRPRSFYLGAIAGGAAGLVLVVLGVWGTVPGRRRKQTL